MKKVLLRASLLALSCSLSVAVLAQGKTASPVSIPAGDLATNIELLRKQTGVEVIYNASELRGSPSKGISGSYSGEDALKRLLAGSGFTLKVDASGAYAISKSPRPTNTPKPAAKKKINDASQSQASGERGEITNLPEMLVQGERIWSLNADIRRTEDDPQPYGIFEREEIERSGATTLEDFIRERLPMNTTGTPLSQAATAIAGNASSVNLRGLGTGQTLILVDGRRLPDFSIGNSTTQASINGIPVGAVERVEVLPTTAGGIYGGSATGGVINIILRRDYRGGELKLTYGNTFDTDVASRRIDFSTGTNFNDGRTNLLLAATVSETNELLVGDRSFGQRGRERIRENNPSFFLDASVPLGGATPNIRSANGAPLVLRDGTPIGSAITYIPVGYSGTASDGGRALIANAGSYNFDLAPSAVSATDGSRFSLSKGPRQYSVMGTIRHAFTPNVSAFVDAAFSQSSTRANYASAGSSAFTINALAPNNPFQQAIIVSLPTKAFDDVYKTQTKQQRVSAGLVASLPSSWQASLDVGWNRSELDSINSKTTLSTFAADVRTGQIDILRDTLAYPINVAAYQGPRSVNEDVLSTLKSATARLGGPLWQLPGGSVNATIQLERRDLLVGESVLYNLGVPALIFPEKAQQVDSVYAELRAPIVSELNAIPGVRELELQLAGRRDEYATRSGKRRTSFSQPLIEEQASLSSTNPTVAVRYVPFESLALRASYGKGFMPPTIDQVTSSPFNSSLTVQDIRRGGETVTTLWRNFGGTSELEPEESESWSAGFVLTPTWVDGLRLSADYTKIKKTNNIYQTYDGQFFVNNEARFPQTVIRADPVAGDAYGVGRIIAIDTLLVNIAQAEVEAVDVQLSYGVNTHWGSFDFYSLATWQTHYRTQVSEESPVVENVGITRNNPLKLRLNAGITWSLGNWSAGWAARYFDSYVVSTSPITIANQGSRHVPSQNYHDLFVGYRKDAASGLKSDIEIQAGLRNVFNTAPPFDASSFPFYSTFGDPNLASYYVSIKKFF